ncbi:MAG: hypothetical protein PVF91_08535 [Chromatiales bacterium]|jgi:hypothetical protein
MESKNPRAIKGQTMKMLIAPFALAAAALLAGPTPAAGDAAVSEDYILLTVLLRHDQSMTVDEIQAHTQRTGFLRMFPPEGVEVVTWHVVMGIGQVVTLKVPPEKLREVNLAVERGAWGAFRSEFYPSYDLWPVIRAKKDALEAEDGE